MESIRKFGLEYCDLPTMLWNLKILLRVLTLNIDKRYTKRIPLIFYVISIGVAACYFYVYLFSMLWMVFMRCVKNGDLTAAAVIFSLGITSEIGTSKLLYMFLNKSLVQDLVEGYLYCDSLVIPGSRFDTNIRKTLRVVKKRAIIFWMVIMINGVVYVIKPFLLPGRHIMEDLLIVYEIVVQKGSTWPTSLLYAAKQRLKNEFEVNIVPDLGTANKLMRMRILLRGLEPMFESPNYEIAYFVTSCGVLCTCYLPANITALLIIVSGYTEAQILALSKEIKHVWEDAQYHYAKNNQNLHNASQVNIRIKNKIINEYIKKELTQMVKIHTMNINLLHQIEMVFRGAILIEFLLLVVGVIAELLGGLENTYLEIPFAVMQVAMDCLLGQRVIDASNAFENAIYGCKWENFDIGNMKTILLMLQNSQKTLKLSAGGVTMLSFRSLMTLLKSVYSAYTTLRSTMNKK